MSNELSIELLRHIVDKLPCTRNGTPVVPHADTVWTTHGLSGRPMQCDWWRLFDLKVWHVKDDPTSLWIPVSCCYSTKELAVAAHEAGIKEALLKYVDKD